MLPMLSLLPLQILVAQADPASATATSAFAELVKTGVLGSLLVLAIIAIVLLWRDGNAREAKCQAEKNEQQTKFAAALETLHATHLAAINTLQSQRIADDQAKTAHLLQFNATCVTALTNAANAMEAQKEGNAELKAAFKEVSDAIIRRRA